MNRVALSSKSISGPTQPGEPSKLPLPYSTAQDLVGERVEVGKQRLEIKLAMPLK